MRNINITSKKPKKLYTYNVTYKDQNGIKKYAMTQGYSLAECKRNLLSVWKVTPSKKQWKLISIKKM